MSQINADTIADRLATVSVPVPTVVAGSAKAWVNFNGTGTVAIRDSFNVASITDNGVGDYTANLTTALSNANYVALSTAAISESLTDSLTTTSYKVYSKISNGTLTDASAIYTAAFSN